MGDPKWYSNLDPVLPQAVLFLDGLLIGERILDELVSRRLLTSDQYGEIRMVSRNLGRKCAARDLFQILRGRPSPSFDTFCDVLLNCEGGRDLLGCLAESSVLPSFSLLGPNLSIVKTRMAPSHTHWKVDEELLITDVIVLEKKFDEGSYGVVYKGFWRRQQVAVKRLHRVFFEECNDQSQFVSFMKKRFERESLIMKSLNHKNILPLYGVFQDEQFYQPSIVTELMDESLDMLLLKGPVGLQDKIGILTQVASALEYLHSRKPPVIHCDLTPKNILVNNKGKVVKLGDYGKAQIASSKPGILMPGSDSYMPLEGHTERPVRSSFDIFSFGVVMLKVLGGEEVTPGPLLDSALIRVPEIERRKNSLDKLKNAAEQGEEDSSLVLKLYKLVLSCLQDMGCDRPSAAEVGQRLKSLSHTNAVQ